LSLYSGLRFIADSSPSVSLFGLRKPQKGEDVPRSERSRAAVMALATALATSLLSVLLAGLLARSLRRPTAPSV